MNTTGWRYWMSGLLAVFALAGCSDESTAGVGDKGGTGGSGAGGSGEGGSGEGGSGAGGSGEGGSGEGGSGEGGSGEGGSGAGGSGAGGSAGQGAGWTVTEDCETGTVGQLPTSKPYVHWGTQTKLVSSPKASGDKACELNIEKGSEGWPSSGGPMEFGIGLKLPSVIPIGGELWVRFSLWVPEEFPLSTNVGMLKFVRIHASNGSNGSQNNGFIDMYMATGQIPIWDPILKKDVDAGYVSIFEGLSTARAVGTAADRPVRDKWETYEVYVKVDSVPFSEGGNAIHRLWKNNKLVGNVLNQYTAVDQTGIVDSILIFSYWNGTAPKDAKVYMDDIAYTNTTPANVDDNGYPYIGGSIP